MSPVFNGDLSSRLAAARDCLIARLGDAVAQWGGTVPEDPGIAELADLLEETAGTFRDQTGAPKTELLAAVNHLRDADRLGGLLPAVTLWHLRRALQQADAARVNA